MAGIATGWMCNVDTLYIFSVFMASVILLGYGMVATASKWTFGVGAMLMMFSLGLYAENEQALEKALQWKGEKSEYTATLVEMPAVRGTNVKVLASVESKSDTVSCDERTNGLVYLYFARTVDSEQLSAGDVVSLEATIISPKNQGNPAEFDIENYYYVKGVSGTAYVAGRKWELKPEKKSTLRVSALKLRARAIALYQRLGFEKEQLSLLSALTLGERRDFPKELKERYSAAGASHVLALSGLHLGVLYMLLAFVLPQRGRNLFYGIFRESAIVVALWGFAFVAGLSPSVVRSATLFTLISLGRLLGNGVSSVNSLSFAAIVMLLFSPHLLYDVSFQMSFAAVLAILLLAPPIQERLCLYNRGWLYSYVANLFILSFVAQVGVLPFVWYYFGMFPVYFLLTNIVVVPLSFVVIMLVAVMWLVMPLPLLQQGIVWLLVLVVDFMNSCVAGIASLPGASLVLPSVGAWGAVCVAIVMLLFVVALLYRRKWMLLLSCCGVVALVVVYLFGLKSADKGDYMIIYNNRKNPLLHLVYEGRGNYLVSTVPQLDAEYEYVSKPFLQQKNLAVPQWADWEYGDSVLQYNEGLFEFNGVSVRLLDNDLWHDNESAEPVDVLVLCRGFLGRINKLVEIYPARCVVVDASLYKRSRERIKREYAELGIDVVDISQTGAMKLVVSGESFELQPMKSK